MLAETLSLHLVGVKTEPRRAAGASRNGVNALKKSSQCKQNTPHDHLTSVCVCVCLCVCVT